MSKLNLYSVFHLNLMYSSIPEEDRVKVIKNCYWPILRLAEEQSIPVGVEMSGLTLQIIKELEPLWVQKFKQLLDERKVELLGSGYAQIIGPLMPAELNGWNQKLGMEVYNGELGLRPGLAWINEQAFSSGIVQYYLDVGYKAVVMEWNNAYRFNVDWDKDWRYFPQLLVDVNRRSVPLVWNNSIYFQKFQRYAQEENTLGEYIDFLRSNVGEEDRFFPLYGSDAEIFDYRPGRYQTEAAIGDGEWSRIRNLFIELKKDARFAFVLPSECLSSIDPQRNKRLILESPEQPIPVKKQEKYNITRWAVSGRNSGEINARCHQIFDFLKNNPVAEPKDWQRLCYFWSSDFRTHIEERRWRVFLDELEDCCKKIPDRHDSVPCVSAVTASSLSDRGFIVDDREQFWRIETKSLLIILNCRRGMAIQSLIFKNIFGEPMIGTLPHGYYEDIGYGADFFSGHTIIEIPGRAKITDLAKVRPVLEMMEVADGRVLSLKAEIKTAIGSIIKRVVVYPDEPRIGLEYDFDLQNNEPMTLRTGIITLAPAVFDSGSLYYETNNGGHPEKFLIKGGGFDHGRTVSTLVSASHCLGATEGWIRMGDRKKFVHFATNKSACYNVPMIQFARVDDKYFFRLAHSLQEIDETFRPRVSFKKQFRVAITAGSVL